MRFVPRALVVAIVLQVALGQNAYQFKWAKESGFNCQSRNGKGNTPLAIGRSGQTFDAGVTAGHCMDKCAASVLCKGFEFQAISGETPVCRYKSQIDSSALIRSPGTTCYVYNRPTTPPPTTPATTMPTTTMPTTIMPTTVAPTTSFFFPYNWAVIRGVDCRTSLQAAIFIGETFTSDGSQTAFDRWPVDKCKQKCAQHDECHGFNYDGNIGVCRYQNYLSHAHTVRNDYNDCWIYERPQPSTRRTAMPTSTPDDKLNHWIRKGIGLLAGSIFDTGRDDTPVVVHGRKLRGAQ